MLNRLLSSPWIMEMSEEGGSSPPCWLEDWDTARYELPLQLPPPCRNQLWGPGILGLSFVADASKWWTQLSLGAWSLRQQDESWMKHHVSKTLTFSTYENFIYKTGSWERSENMVSWTHNLNRLKNPSWIYMHWNLEAPVFPNFHLLHPPHLGLGLELPSFTSERVSWFLFASRRWLWQSHDFLMMQKFRHISPVKTHLNICKV